MQKYSLQEGLLIFELQKTLFTAIFKNKAMKEINLLIARFKLFGNVLSKEVISIIPAAITYRKDDNSRYILEKYKQARDGSEFGPSVREYCTMPVSSKEIKALSDKIFKHYTDYEDIRTLLYDNLFKHLKKNGIKDVTLTNSRGEVEFYMSNPKYKQIP